MIFTDDELALMRRALVDIISEARPQDLQVALELKKKIIAEIDARCVEER